MVGGLQLEWLGDVVGFDVFQVAHRGTELVAVFGLDETVGGFGILRHLYFGVRVLLLTEPQGHGRVAYPL
jgi:hypothetical protein